MTRGDGKLTVDAGNGLTVHIFDEYCHSRGSADNPRQYDRVYDLGADDPRFNQGQFGVRVERDGVPIASCVLAAHSARECRSTPGRVLLRDQRLILAITSSVACLRLPDLELLWQHDVDHGVCCFGLYDLAVVGGGHGGILSHGEMSITRLDDSGGIVWSCSWREIFTGPFELRGDVIHAVDFDGVSLTIALQTGDILAVGGA